MTLPPFQPLREPKVGAPQAGAPFHHGPFLPCVASSLHTPPILCIIRVLHISVGSMPDTQCNRYASRPFSFVLRIALTPSPKAGR